MAQSTLKIICCSRRRDPSLKTFCRSSDVRRFFWKATEDEKTGRIRTSLAWPYREALVNKPAMNRQAAAKPAHIEQKISAK